MELLKEQLINIYNLRNWEQLRYELTTNQRFKHIPEIRDCATEVDRLKGYFCSKLGFNLSKNVLTEK